MEGNGQLKVLEARKLALIEKYMKMQDEADELNEKIYQTCCEVEALNLAIEKAREEEEKKKKLGGKPASTPSSAASPNEPQAGR